MSEKLYAYVVKNINIVQCLVCKSSGFIERKEITSYHNNDYDYWNELCYHCKGEGRVLKTIYLLEATFRKGDGYNSIRTFITEEEEPLNGRTTKDIYNIRENNG